MIFPSFIKRTKKHFLLISSRIDLILSELAKSMIFLRFLMIFSSFFIRAQSHFFPMFSRQNVVFSWFLAESIRRKLHLSLLMSLGKIIRNREKSFFNTDSFNFAGNWKKMIFCPFYETGKNHQNSCEKNVFMLIQTKSNRYCWKSGENDILHLLVKLEKIFRNREKFFL